MQLWSEEATVQYSIYLLEFQIQPPLFYRLRLFRTCRFSVRPSDHGGKDQSGEEARGRAKLQRLLPTPGRSGQPVQKRAPGRVTSPNLYC